MNPTIIVKTGTKTKTFFVGVRDLQNRTMHSFIIVNFDPQSRHLSSQSEMIPAFAGASTDNPAILKKGQFTLLFTADNPEDTATRWR
jgi:hypothetical protein